jgi:biopolymer transport protein ExbB
LIAALIAAISVAWLDPVSAQQAADAGAVVDPTVAVPKAQSEMTFFGLLIRGGILMWPLLALSVFVVALSIERAISLRKEKLIPAGLVTELGQQAELAGGFDPRQSYRLCQTYPSSAARILRAMLIKIGRPQGEVEHAVSEAIQREYNRLQYAVSWIALAAAVGPLLGLLGTVQGITQAFYEFTKLTGDQNPGAVLAEGIYTALVTTLAGLAIAIPATVIAHYFDSKITRQLNEVDEMLASLLPQVERYEGRLRFTQTGDRTAANWREATPEPASSTTQTPR